jgi:D-alanine-D-alanine ligase
MDNHQAGTAGTKLRVGIIYGGRSSEHDVSLRSAASVFKRLDRTRFEAKTIYIDRSGCWHWANIPESFMQSSEGSLPTAENEPEVVLLPRPHRESNGSSKAVFVYQDPALFGKKEDLDVVMLMVHGTNCEDGTLQGLFDGAEIAYTGSGVLGSAIGMDKEISKRLAEHAGIPVVPYRVARAWDSPQKNEVLLADVQKTFGFPVFVKAAREGSSVGVFKVKAASDFLAKLKECFTYDNKVLIEQAIPAREIEFSVMQNSDRSKPPIVSIPAEIIPNHEFYTYEAKYLDADGAIVKVPAEITETQKVAMQKLAQDIFVALEIEGYARVDLFLDSKTGHYYLNEVNTLPGFTSISMFPTLMEASGVNYTDLITRLIELALTRNQG